MTTLGNRRELILGARPYKALFITHDTGHYGAARSLQTFLASYETKQADLLINRRLLRRNDVDSVRRRFGQHVVSVWEGFLPFDRCFKGKPPKTFPLTIRNALARCERRRLLQKIATEHFDFIYLNSLVLHQLIDPQFPFLIHVREIYDGANSDVAKSLEKARGVIFIDSATRAAFPELSTPWIILNNPFNMQRNNTEKAKRLSEQLDIGNRTVFTTVGMINENKGTDFIINSFRRAGRADAILLIVGNGLKTYEEYCRNLAKGSQQIIFHGFEEDIESIYAISDYVVRGEAYPCVGRTIYEALYSGCAVIVPGEAATSNDMFEYARFKDRIYCYQPRQSEVLQSLFRDLRKLDSRENLLLSNVSNFIDTFDGFVEKVL